MARYIDADELIAKLKKQYDEDWQCTVNLSDIGMTIYYAPTADVVEVVFCKDCKHEYTDPFCQMWCRLHRKHEGERLVEEDHFCSYGERRDA